MSNLRSGKAIKREVFEQPQNTLITAIPSDDKFSFKMEFFSKVEDKIDALQKCLDENLNVMFVWVGAKASHVFDLDTEDIERLLDNENK